MTCPSVPRVCHSACLPASLSVSVHVVLSTFVLDSFVSRLGRRAIVVVVAVAVAICGIRA